MIIDQPHERRQRTFYEAQSRKVDEIELRSQPDHENTT
jgi:hypothetical protein